MNNLKKAYVDEINYVIETLVNDEFLGKYQYNGYKDAILELGQGEIREIADNMLDDNELNECLNSTIEYYLKKKIEEKKEVQE